jgi:hypothetical protein
VETRPDGIRRAGTCRRASAEPRPPPRRKGQPVIPEILEITTLRPAPGLTPEDFVAANADINDYLRGRPGFQWRRIVVRADGTVLDIVAYDSIEHARSGAAGITGEMGGSPVHDAIDHATVDWQFTTVIQYVEP